MEKPNIIYIFSDQHRGDALGCSGHPDVKTPNLDKLAEEGVNFTECYTNSPLCMPARASMMTGQYPCTHGVWTNDMEADPNKVPSHVRNIRDNGYYTALIGKTHLYRHGTGDWTDTREKEDIIKDWGFDDIQELTGPLATIRHDSAYTDYLKEKGLLEKHRKYMKDYAEGWGKGEAQPWELPPCPLPTEDHLDSYTGQQTVEWINNYDKDKPFYLQVLFPGPHDPFDSPQEYRDLYDIEEITTGIMEYPKDPVPFYVKGVLKWSGLDDMSTEDNKKLQSYYYAKITLIDEYIGRIMKALEENGLSENTWVVYNSDHGEMLGDHMMSHKIVFYDGAVKIPLIIRPPGGSKARVSKALTDHIDIANTFIDITGAEPLENAYGRSLLPNIECKPEDPKLNEGKDFIFSEVYGFSSIIDDRYKLTIRTDSAKPVELFDLKDDPKELENRVKDPDLLSERKNLLKNLQDGLLPHLDNKKLLEMKKDSAYEKIENELKEE